MSPNFISGEFKSGIGSRTPSLVVDVALYTFLQIKKKQSQNNETYGSYRQATAASNTQHPEMIINYIRYAESELQEYGRLQWLLLDLATVNTT
jgi:hypothetical protein